MRAGLALVEAVAALPAPERLQDRDLFPNPVERDVFGDGGVSVLAHCAEASPATGNAGSTRSPSAEQALCLFGSVGLKGRP